MLNKSIDHPVVVDLPFEAGTGIWLCAATGEEGIAGFELAKTHDQSVTRGEMIGGPALVRSGVAARGIAEEDPLFVFASWYWPL